MPSAPGSGRSLRRAAHRVAKARRTCGRDPTRGPHAAARPGCARGGRMIARRALLLGVPMAAMADTKVHAGTQTNAWTIDSKNFDSFLEVLAAVKRLGFEGFETSFRNVQAQFAKPQPARARLQE